MSFYKLKKVNINSFEYLQNIRKDYLEHGLNFYINTLKTIMKNSKTKQEWEEFYTQWSKVCENGDEVNNIVPSSTLWIIDEIDEIPVGIIDVRKHLNENLTLFGGHVGYEIFPSFRNTKILSDVFNDLKKYLKGYIQDSKALFVCKQTNIASKKILDKHCEYINSITDHSSLDVYCRYWCYL